MAEEWTTEIYGLLPHPSTSRVLMVERESGWALPSIRLEGRPFLYASLATNELRQVLGSSVLAYRFAQINVDEPKMLQEGVFVLEPVKPIPDLSASMAWVGRDELSGLRLENADHRAVVEDVLHELETGIVPEFRQPWEQAGWFVRASSWIETTLASMGREITGPVEQVRLWSLSCVLRAPTVGGDVYLKAVAQQPLFVSEGPLLSYLATVCPGQVPEIITSDPESGWMLTEDMRASEGALSINQKSVILTAFGQMQRTTASHVGRLQALGCADRRPETLMQHIEPLLQDDVAVAALKLEEIRELRQAVPTMIAMCQLISDYSVPNTLVHGDLHPGNIASSDNRLIFFDWTDAAITHPFMDMFMIYDEEDDADRSRMLDAYLQGWTEFESKERLRELWSLCGVIHALYHAVSYQWILRHTEERAKRELEGAMPFLFRKALRYLHEPK